jgi:P27 family predicted phage terminase small subunit
MARGVKKPTKVKRLQGNPGKEKLPENEAEPDSGIPLVPPEIARDKRAVEEWKYITVLLKKCGLMYKTDRAGLMAYCMAVSDLARARKELTKKGSGIVLMSKKKIPYYNPWFNVQNKSIATIAKFMKKYGLSPCDRVGLEVKKDPGKDDPFGKFLEDN